MVFHQILGPNILCGKYHKIEICVELIGILVLPWKPAMTKVFKLGF